jgi:adenosylcobinamide amidohydrolase
MPSNIIIHTDNNASSKFMVPMLLFILEYKAMGIVIVLRYGKHLH